MRNSEILRNDLRIMRIVCRIPFENFLFPHIKQGIKNDY